MNESLARPCAFLAALFLCTMAGCAKEAGVAFVELENDQGYATGARAEPIAIDPRVEVVKNEFQRLYGKDGSGVRQRIVIRGPVMIVPATASRTTPGDNTTQPDSR